MKKHLKKRIQRGHVNHLYVTCWKFVLLLIKDIKTGGEESLWKVYVWPVGLVDQGLEGHLLLEGVVILQTLQGGELSQTLERWTNKRDENRVDRGDIGGEWPCEIQVTDCQTRLSTHPFTDDNTATANKGGTTNSTSKNAWENNHPLFWHITSSDTCIFQLLLQTNHHGKNITIFSSQLSPDIHLQDDIVEADEVLRPRPSLVLITLRFLQFRLQSVGHALIPLHQCAQLDVGQVTGDKADY